jgi:hypothetical protein
MAALLLPTGAAAATGAVHFDYIRSSEVISIRIIQQNGNYMNYWTRCGFEPLHYHRLFSCCWCLGTNYNVLTGGMRSERTHQVFGFM